MTTREKEGRAPSGNSELATVEEKRLAAKTSDKKDYSDKARVYVISSPRAGRGALPKPELGKTERRVLNSGAKLATAILAADQCPPLPLQAVFTPDQTTLYYGKQFQLERTLTDSTFGSKLADIVEEGVIRYIAVMLDDAPYICVSYGRTDRPEFFATVPLGGDTDGEQ